MSSLIRIFRATVAVVAITATIPALSPVAVAQDRAYAVEPVAVTGEPAPETGGLSYVWISGSDLSDSGIVALTAGVNSSSSSEENGIWVGYPGNLTLAVRDGDPAPDRVAQSFYQFGPILMNGNGTLWFGATMRDDVTLTRGGGLGGYWSGTPGNLRSVAGPGEPAPGTPGYTFESFGFAGTFDDSGVSTFAASVTTSVGDSLPGLWTGTPDSLTLLALSGDPAPDTADLAFSQFADPVANNTGTRAFLASTADPNLTYGDGIWIADPVGIRLIARSGEPAPGTGGRTFVSLAYDSASGAGGAGAELSPAKTVGPVLNKNGDVAFNGYLAPYDPVTGIADEGLWIRDSSGLRLVGMVGDPAPGTFGLGFRDFNHLNLNASGQLAFDAALDSPDPAGDHGIWMGLPGALGLVLREGDPAPGTAGETFANLVMGPSLNDRSEIAFLASLNESSTKGVWAGTADDLALIAREGEVLKVKDGDYRTITSITPFDGSPSGHTGRRHFNEAGQLIFRVRFTDWTYGVFLASPVSGTTNQTPIAAAGPDRTVPRYQTTMLDGSGSSDPEGTVLSFVWSLDGVEIGSGPKIAVGPLAVGTHVATLTVTDRNGASSSDDIILTVEENLPPVADAGPDQTANYGPTVTLDGTGSSDPEGLELTYAWSLDGVQIATGATPTVGPFAIGTHTITLTVTDDHGATASDTMILTAINDPPVAGAWIPSFIMSLETTELNGSSSYDPEGDPLDYAWTVDGVPIASGVRPVVGPFEVGTHQVTLTVTDVHGLSASYSADMAVLNRAPVADSGPDQTVNYAELVTLDGTASYDPEGGPLTYSWLLHSGSIELGTGPTPTVGPFPIGYHVISVTVTDEHGFSDNGWPMTLTVVNETPVANAGPDQTVGVKGRTTSVTLDGTAASDPEGRPLAYRWTLNGQLVGTAAVVRTDLAVGEYDFVLTVTDEKGAIDSDTVVITALRGNV